MAEDEVGLMRELMAAAVRMPTSEEMTEEEIKQQIEELIAERPDLREVAERLAVRTQFRAQSE